MEKKNYGVGDEIPIDRKTNEIISMHTTRISALRHAMTEIAECLNETKRKLFDTIFEKYPELKDYEFSVDHEKNVIRISHKKLKSL